jgi:hypothetical protein
VRHHQRCRGADHHGHQVQSRPLGVAQARGAGNTDRADGHQRWIMMLIALTTKPTRN